MTPSISRHFALGGDAAHAADLAIRPTLRGQSPARTPGPLFDEIALVDLSHLVHVLDAHADAMADHEVRKALSVDQHDALRDAGDEIVGGRGKVRGRDENALARPVPLEAADEIAHFGKGHALLGSRRFAWT